MTPRYSRSLILANAQSCPRKRRYESKRDAERSRKRLPHRARVHAYQCTHCLAWHLGARFDREAPAA